MELKELQEKLDALQADYNATLAARDASQKQLESVTKENETLKTQNAEMVTELKNVNTQLTEAKNLVATLSQELSASKQDAGSAVLSVNIGKVRYTTAPGRIYNIEGKPVKAEELVKDIELCKKLVEKGSGILHKA